MGERRIRRDTHGFQAEQIIERYQNAPKNHIFRVSLIRFSEPVSVTDTQARYRFDNGSVHNERIGVSARGDYFQFVIGPDTVLNELKESPSKLRAELDLPWAGSVLLEFNTAGAMEMMSRVSCGT